MLFSCPHFDGVKESKEQKKLLLLQKILLLCFVLQKLQKIWDFLVVLCFAIFFILSFYYFFSCLGLEYLQKAESNVSSILCVKHLFSGDTHQSPSDLWCDPGLAPRIVVREGGQTPKSEIRGGMADSVFIPNPKENVYVPWSIATPLGFQTKLKTVVDSVIVNVLRFALSVFISNKAVALHSFVLSVSKSGGELQTHDT